ncbi:MAG: stage 0 sporulation family protein [Clostridia bacterium]|nr:stage 0 sporulation family protein [Clostridia bacterium]
MTKVVGVRFRDTGKTYYFDPRGIDVKENDVVIVETARGIENGTAVFDVKEVNDDEIVPPLKPVKRVATKRDLAQIEKNKASEKQAFDICKKKIAAHNLEMNLTEVEYTFDTSKIVFYFTADGRVDFRELVKDLSSTFHTRIELRQIGVRDEAKMLGGLGNCGRPFCCSTFLNDFHSVSIKMVKDQGLSLSPTKISGCCGRLMCCLKYEQSSYEYLEKITPRIGSTVEWGRNNKGKVVEVALLTGKLKVLPDDAPDGSAPITINRDEVKIVKSR